MKTTLCQVKGCPNEGRYCRLHLGYTVPVKAEINKVSDKKKDLDKQYKKVRSQYLKLHPLCEAKIEGVCTKVATDIHHKKGKATEELYLDDKHFLATCRDCHQVIEKNPAYSRQMGFSESRLKKTA